MWSWRAGDGLDAKSAMRGGNRRGFRKRDKRRAGSVSRTADMLPARVSSEPSALARWGIGDQGGPGLSLDKTGLQLRVLDMSLQAAQARALSAEIDRRTQELVQSYLQQGGLLSGVASGSPGRLGQTLASSSSPPRPDQLLAHGDRRVAEKVAPTALVLAAPAQEELRATLLQRVRNRRRRLTAGDGLCQNLVQLRLPENTAESMSGIGKLDELGI